MTPNTWRKCYSPDGVYVGVLWQHRPDGAWRAEDRSTHIETWVDEVLAERWLQHVYATQELYNVTQKGRGNDAPPDPRPA